MFTFSVCDLKIFDRFKSDRGKEIVQLLHKYRREGAENTVHAVVLKLWYAYVSLVALGLL